MGRKNIDANYEHEEPQALVLRPEHCRLLRAFTFFSVSALIILVFILLGFFSLVLPQFEYLFDGMNLTLPLPAKVLIAVAKRCRPFFEFQLFHMIVFFLAVLALLFSGIGAVKYLSRKSKKDFLIVFLLEITVIMGFLFFFLIILVLTFVALSLPLYQFHGNLH